MQMKKENVVAVSCPPCGENVALATKRGAYKAISLMSPSIGPADHFLRKGGRLAFTLIELLVVVLIIGILAAVAVPQYQKAVYKSRFSTMMPIAKTLANANEIYYTTNGEYATDPAKLSVTAPINASDGMAMALVNDENYAYVIASRPDLPHNTYIMYQNYSKNFPANIHCEAHKDDSQAQALCKSVGGVLTTGDGSQTEDYLTYIIQGSETEGRFAPSIRKLATQLCEGKDGCFIDEEAETVTTEQCGNNISYNKEGNVSSGQGCLEVVYDSEGNIKSTSSKICGFAGSLQNGICVPAGMGLYESIYAEDGTLTEIRACQNYSQQVGCSDITQTTYEENKTTEKRFYCNEAINPQNLICKNSNAFSMEITTRQTYENGNRYEGKRTCVWGAVDQNTGECTQYSSIGMDTSYNVDRKADDSFLKTNCIQFQGTECVENGWVPSIVWNASTRRQIQCNGAITESGCSDKWYYNFNGSTGYCSGKSFDSVDWDTVACK